FDPRELDAVVLSHAHVDHCGHLPLLVREGYRGPIYCTPATKDLLTVVLTDSARIQDEEARIWRILGQAEEEAGPASSVRQDVRRVVEQCVPLAYDEVREILPGILLRLVDAGHILGSAMAALTVRHGGRDHSLTFTGDLGRRGVPFMRDPAPVPVADLLV